MSSSFLSPVMASAHAELKLLLAAARVVPRDADLAQIRALAAAGLDWERLVELAAWHHVTPLLSRSLRAARPSEVPPEVLERLQAAYTAVAQHNLFMLGELLSVMRAFEAQGLAAATFKGPHLAALVYGNLALRQFGDLDILIHKADFRRAREVLIERGYQPALTLSPDAEQAHLRAHHDYPLTNPRGPVMIELQWGLLEEPFRFPPDFERWWGRLIPQTIAGQKILGFAPTDLLHVLCVHGCKHLWERLNWICDVAEQLRAGPQIEWDALKAEATRLGSRRMIYVGLLLAHTLLDADLPAAVLQEARGDPVAAQLARRVCERLFTPQELALTIEEDAPLFYLMMHERWRDRAHILLRFYPSLLRPVRVLRKYHGAFLRPLLER